MGVTSDRDSALSQARERHRGYTPLCPYVQAQSTAGINRKTIGGFACHFGGANFPILFAQFLCSLPSHSLTFALHFPITHPSTTPIPYPHLCPILLPIPFPFVPLPLRSSCGSEGALYTLSHKSGADTAAQRFLRIILL